MNYEYEERAAIMEFDGGLTRAQAEIEATKLLKPKVKNKHPSGIPPELLKSFPEGDSSYVKKLMDEFRKKYGG